MTTDNVLVRVTGHHHGNDFVAGMTLQEMTRAKGYYKIIQIAPILKMYFYTHTKLTLKELREKCIRYNWILEVSFSEHEVSYYE